MRQLIKMSSKRVQMASALLLTLLAVPLASTWNTAEAKPPSHAPAYGYRHKEDKKWRKSWSKKGKQTRYSWRDARDHRNGRKDDHHDSGWNNRPDNRWDGHRDDHKEGHHDSRWDDHDNKSHSAEHDHQSYDHHGQSDR